MITHKFKGVLTITHNCRDFLQLLMIPRVFLITYISRGFCAVIQYLRGGLGSYNVLKIYFLLGKRVKRGFFQFILSPRRGTVPP